MTLCRLGRLVGAALACSGSGAGLGSRALRFFAEVARVDGPGGATVELVDTSGELAACLAAALVVLLLGGMSMCV